jgi:hypothetical protein
MSLDLLANELSRFLGTDTPEVFCITGRWGVGKTYAWNHYLRVAQAKNAVRLDKYSYVSIFGRSSIEDIRTTIVENTVDSRVSGKRPDLSSFESVVANLTTGAKELAKLASYVPAASSYVTSANRALFLMVKNQIVCIDDLERAGSGLDIKSVLGLISSLKEEKACKVVLLLNHEEIEKNDRTEFDSQLEKVVDTFIIFDPTPEEAANLGLDTSMSFHEWLKAHVITLGVVNLRVIKKIERFCRRLLEILDGYDQRILKQAVHTAALGGFSKLQPDSAPPFDFIRKPDAPSRSLEKDDAKEPDPHAVFMPMLRSYGFGYPDELDLPILDGIDRGFFDESAIRAAADKLQKKLLLRDKNDAFHKAWQMYHHSFDDNQDAVLDAIYESLHANIEVVTPVDLSSTVSLFKELGRDIQAQEMVKFYVSNRSDDPWLWDLEESSLGHHVTDPDVRQAFEQKRSSIAPSFDAEETLKRIGAHGGIDNDEIVNLARLFQSDYVRIFKKLNGDDRRHAIRGALYFRKIANADEHMKKITTLAEDALRTIAAENPLNAKRVQTFGITLADNAVPKAVQAKS